LLGRQGFLILEGDDHIDLEADKFNRKRGKAI